MSLVGERLRWVTESLLENESLTAGLAEQAAQEVLDWGLLLAQEIVASTANLDDAAAEVVMEPRLQALRRLLRDTSHFLAEAMQLTPEEAQRAVDKLVKQAQRVYGTVATPTMAARDAFVQTIGNGLSAIQIRTFLHGEELPTVPTPSEEISWQTAVAHTPLPDLDERYHLWEEEEE